MPKRKVTEPPDVQSARFKRDAQALIDAGELNPTEADKAFERLLATGIKASSGNA